MGTNRNGVANAKNDEERAQSARDFSVEDLEDDSEEHIPLREFDRDTNKGKGRE
jgi:hypothetical protein